jgi:hypothetical protein
MGTYINNILEKEYKGKEYKEKEYKEKEYKEKEYKFDPNQYTILGPFKFIGL